MKGCVVLAQVNIRMDDSLKAKADILKHDLSAWWSRQIDDTNRVVYRIRMGTSKFFSVRGIITISEHWVGI